MYYMGYIGGETRHDGLGFRFRYLTLPTVGKVGMQDQKKDVETRYLGWEQGEG
jgi:hypothetical protein